MKKQHSLLPMLTLQVSTHATPQKVLFIHTKKASSSSTIIQTATAISMMKNQYQKCQSFKEYHQPYAQSAFQVT